MAGKHSHKRETARIKLRASHIAGSLAVLATGAAVTAGVLGSEAPRDLVAVDQGAPPAAAIGSNSNSGSRDFAISRGGGREDDKENVQVEEKPPALSEVDRLMLAAAVETAIQNAEQKLWTSTALNLWTRPDQQAEKVGVLEEGEQVLITGRESTGREEIVLDGEALWVTSGYLTAEEPTALGGECTNGTTAESGVAPGIAAVHETVCANWPEITSYGFFRSDSDSDHSTGRAVDIMISGQTGWDIAEFLRANYSEFGISYIIFSQRIWSVERSSEGWRAMEDRGSVTANHYDHVHVSVY